VTPNENSVFFCKSRIEDPKTQGKLVFLVLIFDEEWIPT
jgi:hypothetical protein